VRIPDDARQSTAGGDLYELRPRQITEEDQRVWVPQFSCGKNWWEREIDDFLKKSAWDHHQRGDSKTTLYSAVDGKDEIVAFMTTTALMLQVSDVESVIGFTDSTKPGRFRLPAVHLLYAGVDYRFQRRGHGQEMLLRLYESLEAGPVAPRFVHLEVWTENEDAIRLYERNGFKPLGPPKQQDISGEEGKTAPLLRMVLDRFGLR
jgi:ribosomal protein S18 acetylase RimI-like enzyme